MTGLRRGRAAGWLAAAALAALSPVRGRAQVPLFDSDSALPVTLRTDLRALMRDKDTTRIVWRDATISYAGSGGEVTVPLKVRTRGGYRLAHCDYPPIRLRFADSTARGTLFERLRSPKLTTHCRSRQEYEEIAPQEYAIYRVLALFTPVSLRARMLRVTWEDAAGAVRPLTRYALVTEDPDRLARRLGGTYLTTPGAKIGTLQPSHAALLGVFQYFIGNTDWSVPGLHNIALLSVRDTTFPVPYDFDWSGVINAPYARPAPILPIRSVRERIYRGFCQGPTVLEPVLARFETLRDTIRALYRAIPGMEPGVLEKTERYYDDFYLAIADRERFAQRVVRRDCMP